MSILSVLDIKNKIKKLHGRKYKNGAIIKDYSFSSYMKSIDFISFLAKISEENNHHPDMVVGWCKITVSFTSHDKGGVTESCIQMAREADKIYM